MVQLCHKSEYGFIYYQKEEEEKITKPRGEKKSAITAGQIWTYNSALFVSRQKAVIFPSSARRVST